MAAAKDTFKWKLRYGDLVNAAKAIDDLRKRAEKHDGINIVDNPDAGRIYEVTWVLPFTRIPTAAFEDLDKALHTAVKKTKCRFNVWLDEEALISYECPASVDEYRSVADYVEMLVELLDRADNVETYAMQIMKQPSIKRVAKKYPLF